MKGNKTGIFTPLQISLRMKVHFLRLRKRQKTSMK